MARKKSYRRKRRRRVVRYRKMRVPRNQLSLMGDKKFVKMKYTFLGQIPVATGIPQSLSFRANSINDPSTLTGGGRPRGYDEMIQLFAHYTVLGSKCTVTFLHNQGALTHPVVNFIQLYRIGGFVIVNPRDAIESRHASYCTWSPGQGTRGQQLTRKFSAKKFFSKKDVVDDPDLSAFVTSDPSTQAFYNISFAATHNATLIPCDVIVNIEYAVLFTDGNNPVAS